MALNRAYSLVTIKGFDPVKRTFSGIATSPEADRVGDTIAADGVTYKNPLPLLLYHNNTKPVGEAAFGRQTKDGTPFQALISTIDRESGVVKERLDEAIDSLAAKPPLIRGVSIGFRPVEDPTFNKDTGGFHFPKIEVLELSMVVVPAHQNATIDLVKSLDAPYLAASGTDPVAPKPAGVTALPTGSKRMTPTNYGEKIADLSNQRAACEARMVDIQEKALAENNGKDEAQRQEFDDLTAKIDGFDKEIADLRLLERINKTKALPVAGATPDEGSQTRSKTPVIRFTEQLPPGLGFARAVKAATVAKLDARNLMDVAKEMYPSDDRLHAHLDHVTRVPMLINQIKAAVPAATTTNTTWASALVDPTNLAGEFIEFLRPATIIGRLNLRNIPFNVRMIEQTQGGTGYWVGQGAPKPLTAFGFAPVTLGPTKVAAISVITEEAARFSTPSLDAIVRDALRDALVERIDRDLLNPAEAGTANVQPASLTNGLTALTSSGTSADNARTDLANLVQAIRSANLRGRITIVMPDSLATGLAFTVNSLGQPEFPGLTSDGGTINGLRVITSEYVANASGAGNMVVAIAESEVFLADDGGVTVDASREASLQMLDNPTNNSATATATTMVSMWQTNSIALRAERFINWLKRRDEAVAYMDDVNWGSVGSP